MPRSKGSQGWPSLWKERFVTLMVIPERTRRVHKLVVPFFLLKLGIVLLSLAALFFVIIGIDYMHVLGRMAENKRLKGENFKLRQELQLIRNKVETMESTVDRVRNYAKKLQLLTGQEGQVVGKVGAETWDSGDGDNEREPTAKPERHSRLSVPSEPEPAVGLIPSGALLGDRVEKLQSVSSRTETGLSRLQVYLLARSAILAATPSLLPITGWISSAFGYRVHPLAGVYRMHAGVDIAAELGAPVRAPADGKVIFSGYKEGYGKVVVIDHGYHISTLFAHNSKLFASYGLKVKRGDIISLVGSTGHSTGPHLHYEVRKNGVPVNPTAFFSRARF